MSKSRKLPKKRKTDFLSIVQDLVNAGETQKSLAVYTGLSQSTINRLAVNPDAIPPRYDEGVLLIELHGRKCKPKKQART